jgi:5-methylcytosine-specific restriction endonuclease McrA
MSSQMSSQKKLVREAFRQAVFKRDGHKCRVCKIPGRTLDAHHITDRNEMPNGGYVKENGISLCPDCHERAEVFHSSGGTKTIPLYEPWTLYMLINSSKELAIKASERL